MKICFATYPTAFQQPGGGEAVLNNLRASLARQAVEVDLFDQWNASLADYDVVHYFSSYGSDEFNRLRRHARALAVTPFIWPALPWRARLRNVIRPRRPFAGVDLLFPTSRREASLLVQNYGVDQSQVAVVPHGVERRFAEPASVSFAESCGLERYVLCPGRIDPNKNQLRVVRALRDLDVDLVVLGSVAAGHEDYERRCRAAAGPRTLFLPALAHDSELLVDAYRAAAAVVIASEYELCSIAALEAGAAGAPLVSTNGGGMPEHLEGFAEFFDPGSEPELRRAVEAALERGRREGQTESFLRRFDWDEIARETIRAYERVQA